MHKLMKRKKQPIQPPKSKHIHLSEQEFTDMVINFESGKMTGEDVLIYFAYLSERDMDARFSYPWLMDFIERGIIVDGLVNPLRLKQYKATK